MGEILGVEDLARLIETAEATEVSPAVGLSAGDIMTPDPVTVGPEADWRALSALFVQHGFRSLPVVDGLGRFLGLISVQTILRPGAQGLVARHLAQEVTSLPPEARLPDLLPSLAQGHQPALPVVDEDGSLVGIITRSDIVAALVHAMSHP
jgi:CBS domain-containing membrane protein